LCWALFFFCALARNFLHRMRLGSACTAQRRLKSTACLIVIEQLRVFFSAHHMSKRNRRLNLKPPGRCIFCGRMEVSKEHFWPEWAHNLIKTHTPSGNVEDVWVVSAHSPTPSLTHRRDRQGSVLTKSLRCVCGPCNNGWMGTIEDACGPVMTPLIVGDKCNLDEDDQKLIAIWTTLKLFVAEKGVLQKHLSTQDERTSFMNGRIFPPKLKIWIGHCGQGGWESGFWRSVDTIGFPWQETRPPGPNIQTVTIGFGDLLIHARHSKAEVEIELKGENFLYRIWPLEDSTITWPPKGRLTQQQASRIADVLGELGRSPGVIRLP
jgi:hypothetical protein